MIQLTDVRVFLEVVSKGSFTLAAQSLKLPKSSVARQIARLEDELMTRLITRTTRTLKLTQEGRTFLPHARRLLDDSIEAENVLHKNQDGSNGLLTITASSTFGRSYLAPLVPAFRRKHPNIRLNLKLTAKKMELGVGHADIAIRLGSIADSKLNGRKFGNVAFCLVASPDYLKKRTPPKSPLDLAAHEIIELRPPAQDNQLELSRGGKTQCIRCVPAVEMDDPDAVRLTSIAGGGIAPLPCFLVADDVKNGRLAQILPGWELQTAPVNLVYSTESAPPLRVRAFIDFLLDRFERDFPWEHKIQAPMR